MDRRMQIVVAVLAALEVVLLSAWVAALVTADAGAPRLLGVALFLAATATVIAAVAVVAARGPWRGQHRVRR
ncbi:hypothetical protein [Microbacterium sp. GXF7504]